MSSTDSPTNVYGVREKKESTYCYGRRFWSS